MHPVHPEDVGRCGGNDNTKEVEGVEVGEVEDVTLKKRRPSSILVKAKKSKLDTSATLTVAPSLTVTRHSATPTIFDILRIHFTNLIAYLSFTTPIYLLFSHLNKQIYSFTKQHFQCFVVECDSHHFLSIPSFTTKLKLSIHSGQWGSDCQSKLACLNQLKELQYTMYSREDVKLEIPSTLQRLSLNANITRVTFPFMTALQHLTICSPNLQTIEHFPIGLRFFKIRSGFARLDLEFDLEVQHLHLATNTYSLFHFIKLEKLTVTECFRIEKTHNRSFYKLLNEEDCQEFYKNHYMLTHQAEISRFRFNYMNHLASFSNLKELELEDAPHSCLNLELLQSLEVLEFHRTWNLVDIESIHLIPSLWLLKLGTFSTSRLQILGYQIFTSKYLASCILRPDAILSDGLEEYVTELCDIYPQVRFHKDGSKILLHFKK